MNAGQKQLALANISADGGLQKEAESQRVLGLEGPFGASDSHPWTITGHPLP